MRGVGAHEVLVEGPQHDRPLWLMSDAEIAQFLKLCAHRLQDLQRDPRFKYVTVFKNHGRAAGEGLGPPTPPLTAPPRAPPPPLSQLLSSPPGIPQNQG